jgi:hypothetical protein
MGLLICKERAISHILYNTLGAAQEKLFYHLAFVQTVDSTTILTFLLFILLSHVLLIRDYTYYNN